MTTSIADKANAILLNITQPTEQLVALYELYDFNNKDVNDAMLLETVTNSIEELLDLKVKTQIVLDSDMHDAHKLAKITNFWMYSKPEEEGYLELQTCMEMLTQRIHDNFVTQSKRAFKKTLTVVGLVAVGSAAAIWYFKRK